MEWGREKRQTMRERFFHHNLLHLPDNITSGLFIVMSRKCCVALPWMQNSSGSKRETDGAPIQEQDPTQYMNNEHEEESNGLTNLLHMLSIGLPTKLPHPLIIRV